MIIFIFKDEIDLDVVKKSWLETEGPAALKNIAEHYGIFSHLYEHGYFTPYLPLKISYDYDEDSVTPVHMGNILQASEVRFLSFRSITWLLQSLSNI